MRLRGQAELVGALLAVTALVLVLGYALYTLYTFQLSTTQTSNIRYSFEYERLSENLLLEETAQGLCVYNIGVVPVKLVRIWYTLGTTPYSYPVDIELAPGQSVCGLDAYVPGPVAAIVTARGNIFKYQPPIDVQVASAQVAEVAQSVLLESIPVFGETLDDLRNSSVIYVDPLLLNEPTVENVQQGLVKGMVRYDENGNVKSFVLTTYYENVKIVFRGARNSLAEVGNVFIAYEPGNKTAYNMLITGPGRPSSCSQYGPVLEIYNATNDQLIETLSLPCYPSDPTGWRLRIEGLYNVSDFQLYYAYSIASESASYTITSIDDARGYWWYYGGSTGIEVQIRFEGYARKLFLYMESPGNPRSSYTPYLFVGDVDGNGLAELVFTTEDMMYGGIAEYWFGRACTADELGEYLDVSENTTVPFFMYLVGFPIDSTKYSMIVVTARIYYHDTEGGDTECVSDPQQFLLGFYLVDPGPDGQLNTADDEIASSHEFIYQQLDDYEDTFPPNTNFVTVTVPLLIPDTGKTYYVVVGFMDPYGDVRLDDVDFTVVVESVGLTYYARG